MAFESLHFFFLKLSLLLFFFLLSFDHSKEVVAFGFGLLSHHGFAFVELSLASELKFSGSLRGLLSCQLLLAALLAFAFFESTLGTKCVYL